MTEALTVDVVDSTGKKTGSVELPAEVFDAPLNIPLMHQVVVGQLAAARQVPPRRSRMRAFLRRVPRRGNVGKTTAWAGRANSRAPGGAPHPGPVVEPAHALSPCRAGPARAFVP